MPEKYKFGKSSELQYYLHGTYYLHIKISERILVHNENPKIFACTDKC